MNKSRRYNKLLCTLLLTFVGVVSVNAETATFTRPSSSTTALKDIKTSLPTGVTVEFSGDPFTKKLGNNYGYYYSGQQLSISFSNFKYEVTEINMNCYYYKLILNDDPGEGTITSVAYDKKTKTPTANINPDSKSTASYNAYSGSLAGLSSIQYKHTNGESGTGDGAWLCFPYGSTSFLQITYNIPTISIDNMTMQKDSYTLTSDDNLTWTSKGAFSYTDIVFSISAGDCVTISEDGKTIKASSIGTATIKASLMNNNAKVTSTTFDITVGEYALTSDSKNVHAYGSTITDDVITGAHTFLREKSADNVNALVYVENGTYTGSKNNVVVKGGDGNYTCANLVLTDKVDVSIPIEFTATKASYSREMGTSNWGTICLPFAPKANGVTFYSLSKAADKTDGTGVLTFTSVANPEANVPYVFYTDGDYSENNSDCDVSATVDANLSKDAEWTLNGTYNRISVCENGTASATNVIAPNSLYIKSNKFYKIKEVFNLSAFRAYFLAPINEAKASVFSLEADETNAINTLMSDDEEVVGYYNAQGIKSNGIQMGMNIIKYKSGKTVKLMIK